MNRLVTASMALALSAGFTISAVRAGEDAGGEKPKRERGGDREKGGERGGDRGGGPGGAGGRGAWQGGGPGGAGGPGGIANAFMGNQRGGVVGMASRMLGIDIEDPKAGPKLESLPLGAEKRMVMYVPVGGVDNFSGTGQGWKVESVFKMTEEQTKAVDTLREEYKTEQKKLEQEILEQQKAIADKVKQLRAKYEQRANDVLTGDDKAAKEKMDALAKETNTKNAAVVAEFLPMFDANDMMQGFAMLRSIREKTSLNIKGAEEKLVELTPADSRERIQEVIKTQAAVREQTNRFGGGGGGGAPGAPGGERRARGGNNGEPQKPPAPPEQTEKKDF